jgi:putative glutamine amidotransferase
MTRPVVGICAALERARWSHWDQQAYLLPRSYMNAIQGAGGIALMFPPDPHVDEDPDAWLDRVDAIIFAGGADIDPASYGAETHPETKGTVPERDAFEIVLARRAVERDMPVLGVCRGMQLLNVAAGGTLLQHLPDDFGHHEHRRVRGTFDGADHDVRLQPGSLAERAAAELTHNTKSHHHQGVDAIGEGYVVTGWSTLDDLPETIEATDRRWVLGVQWHPEADAESKVVGALVAEAQARLDERAYETSAG